MFEAVLLIYTLTTPPPFNERNMPQLAPTFPKGISAEIMPNMHFCLKAAAAAYLSAMNENLTVATYCGDANGIREVSGNQGKQINLGHTRTHERAVNDLR